MSNQKLKILIIINDSGAGHRTTGNALISGIRKKSLPWSMKTVSFFKDVMRMDADGVYNAVVKYGLHTLYWWFIVPSFKLRLALFGARWVSKWEKYLSEEKPDAVVSVIPFVNHILYKGIQSAVPDIPFIVLATDYDDTSPSSWIQDQGGYFISPSEKLTRKLIDHGFDKNNIRQINGVVLRSEFYQEVEIDRNQDLSDLGLDPALPVALVFFGGSGGDELKEIAHLLQRKQTNVQCLFMCGRNEDLYQYMVSKFSNGNVVFGYTKNYLKYLRVTDFVIGKPGAGFVFEAIQQRKPIITIMNKGTLKQERPNAQYIIDHGLGIVVESIQDIPSAVNQLTQKQDRKELSAIEANRSNSLSEAIHEIEKIMVSQPTGIKNIKENDQAILS